MKHQNHISILIMLVIGGATAAMIDCTTTQARQGAAAGLVAAFDCEAAHFDATAFGDATAFASAEIQRWIGGTAPTNIDSLKATILADLKPIGTDLDRCAVAGVLAGATAATTQTPGMAAGALTSGPDPAVLRAAFSVAVRQLGWAPVRVSPGVVL